MPQSLKVLIVEDNPDDAEMELLELRSAGFEPDWLRVDTEVAYLENLNSGLDLVLSDFQMPRFNGLRALELLKQSGLDIPFILISGTIGEDTAVTAIKNGATDYLLKDRLGRLSAAVTNALAETRLRHERRNAELAAQRPLSELRVLFDLIPAMIWFKDTQNRILRVNRRVAEFVGKTVEEIEGKPAQEIYPQEPASFYADDLEVIRSGVPKLGFVEMIPGPVGLERWVQTDKVPVLDKDGIVIGLVVMAQDITERRRLDGHFLQAQKMEALGQFSGGIAHDFNNLLAIISGNTELALMVLEEDSEARDYLGSVFTATRRAVDLVQQILTFSRHQPQVRHLTNLQLVVAESLKLMRATIPSTIEFETLIATDLPAVLANANQIHQVLMNLGINAWHSMRDCPGKLRVKLEKLAVSMEQATSNPNLRAGDYVRVSISDTGRGMDAATLQRIFEPFFTTKSPGEGTGLGLSVVHGIMDSHEGAVTVQSQPGEGTTFRLYFPVYDGVANVNTVAVSSSPRGKGERILVVDDEELLAKMVQKALIRIGYEAEFTSDPSVAIAWVHDDPERFKLVLLDYTMPRMTGLTLALELRQIQPALSIILMTGNSLSLTAEHIAGAGICELLLKPVTILSLATAVQAALSSKPLKTKERIPLTDDDI